MQTREEDFQKMLLSKSNLNAGMLDLGWKATGIPFEKVWQLKELYLFLQKHTQITSLALSVKSCGYHLYPDDFELAVNSIYSLTTLHSLNVVGDASYNCYAERMMTVLAQNSSLTKLDLPHNRINNVEAFRGNKTVTSLRLFNNVIGDSEAAVLATLPHITDLDVVQNPIFNYGFETLAAMTTLRHLSIGIATTWFTAEKMRIVARNTSLISLTIGYDIEPNLCFEPMKRMTSLQRCLDGSSSWHGGVKPIKALEMQMHENNANLKARRNSFIQRLILLALVRNTSDTYQYSDIPLDLIYKIFTCVYTEYLLTEVETKNLIRDVFGKQHELQVWRKEKKDEVSIQVYKNSAGVGLIFKPIKQAVVITEPTQRINLG